tara:strand:+ start:2579 stop:3829 length:1251 start_codon:yes stop_codon:yes gene_type:complete
MAVLGSTVDPRLGAVNPAAIQALSQAGAATGQMYQNLGQSVAGVMEDAKEKKTSDRLYQVYSEKLSSLADATDSDVKGFRTVLEAAKEGGPAAMNQFHGMASGLFTSGVASDSQTKRLRMQLESSMDRLHVAREYDENEINLNNTWKKNHETLDHAHDKRLLKIKNFQETKEREGSEDYITYLEGIKHDYGQLDAKQLYNLQRRNALSLEKAETDGDIRKARAIAEMQYQLEEVYTDKQIQKSRDLTQELIAARGIEDETKRKLALQDVQTSFREAKLAVPDIDNLILSSADLRNKIIDGSFSKNNIPESYRSIIQDTKDASAQEIYGNMLLSSQGLLFKDESQNKEFINAFEKRYGIRDKFFKGVFRGLDYYTSAALNAIPGVGLFVDDFDLDMQKARRDNGLTVYADQTPTLNE